MKKINLESTTIRGGYGTSVEIKTGGLVNLINPDILESKIERKMQEDMNERLQEDLGNQPYGVLEIYLVPSGTTLLKVKGKIGKEEEISKDYFCGV